MLQHTVLNVKTFIPNGINFQLKWWGDRRTVRFSIYSFPLWINVYIALNIWFRGKKRSQQEFGDRSRRHQQKKIGRAIHSNRHEDEFQIWIELTIDRRLQTINRKFMFFFLPHSIHTLCTCVCVWHTTTIHSFKNSILNDIVFRKVKNISQLLLSHAKHMEYIQFHWLRMDDMCVRLILFWNLMNGMLSWEKKSCVCAAAVVYNAFKSQCLVCG